jgi:hypothetical protein
MKMINRQLRLMSIKLCIAFLMFGCADSPKGPENDWIRSPHSEVSFVSRIPSSDFAELDIRTLSEATAILSDTVFMRVDPSDVKHFVPAMPPSSRPGNELKYYLVRAVKYDATGSFSVYRSGHEIYVSHVSLGSRNRKVFKSVILIAVEFELDDAFADYSSAE